MPTCSTQAAKFVTIFSYPSIGAAGLKGFDLVFTDQNKHTWVLFSGQKKPIEDVGWHPRCT